MHDEQGEPTELVSDKYISKLSAEYKIVNIFMVSTFLLKVSQT